MNNAKMTVLNDAQQRLDDLIRESNYYHTRLKEVEEKIIAYKEIIAEMQSMPV